MSRASEIRFVLVVDDHEAAMALYRDAFGLEVLEDFGDEHGKGVLMGVPSATLEVVDKEHGRMVDEMEAGRPFVYGMRIAIRVDDLADASRAVAAAGAEALAEPVQTPWGDRNRRFVTVDGTQLTLFSHRAVPPAPSPAAEASSAGP
jgi:predicted enzyme related to lactoylglutathione lyase